MPQTSPSILDALSLEPLLGAGAGALPALRKLTSQGGETGYREHVVRPLGKRGSQLRTSGQDAGEETGK